MRARCWNHGVGPSRIDIFFSENWSAALAPASSPTPDDPSPDYGSMLLEVVVASAADAVSTRPDLLHRQLAALISTYVKRHGVESSGSSQFGLRPLSLYRCIEVMLRMHFFFSRKKLYSGRLARWAESSGRHRDVDSLKRVRGNLLQPRVSLIAVSSFQDFESARHEAALSRSNLSDLLKSLIIAVETEFRSVFPPDDTAGLDDRATLPMLVAPFKSLVKWFRTSDSASPVFCSRMHNAASKALGAWARAMSDRGCSSVSRYFTTSPSQLRSSAVDVLVALGIICKVGDFSCGVLILRHNQLVFADCVVAVASGRGG